ncbi:MAG TPA: GNAT family N-acetyltransferase [Actinopolymorphaceae bacterium]
MEIRSATVADWPGIWRFMRGIVAAADTYCWDPDIEEDLARQAWLRPAPARTFVAVAGPGTDGTGDDGAGDTDATDRIIVGTAEIHPNQGGPGSHVANAAFMVDPAYAGRGVGRALGEYVIAQARADRYRAMQFNAVVETNTRAVDLWRSLGFTILTTVPEAFLHPTKGYVGLHVMHRFL